MPHCKKCGEANPDNFYSSCAIECKECVKNRVRLNYRKNIGHFVAYEKERECRPERKEFKFFQMQKHRRLNPDKYKARTAVGNALRDGRIVKKNCVRCGSIDSQAHHKDYSKPLDVVWMCFSCHRLEHGQEPRSYRLQNKVFTHHQQLFLF